MDNKLLSDEEKLMIEIFGRPTTKKKLEMFLDEQEERRTEENEYYSSFNY